MQYIGLDIGGANIKFASLTGEAQEIPLPIWKDKRQLGPALNKVAATLSVTSQIGVTMTAELADCFSSRRDGVKFIVDTVTDSFPNHQPMYYRTDGTMCDAIEAVQNWEAVAASNWHALAWNVFLDSDCQSGFAIDIGSTTSDFIPVENGLPAVPSQTDLDRLRNGQLFYAGVGRTPVCSILSEVELSTGTVTIARELFATMDDVFLWLSDVEPDASSCATADGRPRTRDQAGMRLARMLCSDFPGLSSSEISQIAIQAKQSLVKSLSLNLQRVMADHPGLPANFKVSGRGAWLFDEIIAMVENGRTQQASINVFSTNLTTSQAAAAFAVATKMQHVHGQKMAAHD